MISNKKKYNIKKIPKLLTSKISNEIKSWYEKERTP